MTDAPKRLKFTERTIAGLPAPAPSGKQMICWDSKTPGFGILISGVSATMSYVVQRKLPDGRTRRVTIDRVSNIALENAREEATDLLHRIHKGDDPKAKKAEAMWTLRRSLNNYLKARTNLRDKSSSSYRYAIERHLAAWLDLPLSAITPEMVEEKHAAIQKEIELHSPRAQAARENGSHIRVNGHATADGAMRAFRAIWNFAADRLPALPASPTRRLKRMWFKVGRRERLVRGDQLPAFHRAIAALPNPVARDYLLMLLYSGMRRSEAAGLRWTDIDLSAGVIRIPAIRMKANRRFDLPMSDLIYELLVVRRRDTDWSKSEFVFPAHSFSGHVEEPKFPLSLVAKSTGIRVSAHDLRRTFATIAEGADISESALKLLLHHTLGTDATSGYIIATVERLREPAQRVADRIKELCGVSQVEGANVEKLRS
jgi:integrase